MSGEACTHALHDGADDHAGVALALVFWVGGDDVGVPAVQGFLGRTSKTTTIAVKARCDVRLCGRIRAPL